MGPFLLLVALLLTAPVAPAQNGPATPARPETYRKAEINGEGLLVITRTDGKTIVIAKRGEQSSFLDPIVSDDGTSVGAQAGFRGCCTSYDLPLELLIYRNGRTHRVVGSGLPIFHWRFVDGGKRVAFGEEPAHFGCRIHYELRDIDSNRRLDTVDVPVPCGQRPNPDPVKIPWWAEPIVPADLLTP